MKRAIILLFILFFVVSFSCKKEPKISDGGNKIEVGQTTIDSSSYFTATIKTAVTGLGGNDIMDHGHCWNTDKAPTIESKHTSLGPLEEASSYSSSLDSLLENTTYYVRPYLNYGRGIVYGQEKTFVTWKTGIPVCDTTQILGILSIGVQIKSAIVADSGLSVTDRGFCWDTTSVFNLQSSQGSIGCGAGLGSIDTSLTGLNEGTRYWIKSYAINEKGVSYGLGADFTTSEITLPSVVTDTITTLGNTFVITRCEVTGDGNGNVNARGVCWSMVDNPTLENCAGSTQDGTGLGQYESTISSLTESTPYYYRAYATNEKGTAYGLSKGFTTLSGVVLPVVTTEEITNISQSSAIGGGNVTSDGGGTVSQRGICWSSLQDPTVNDNHTNDGSGSGSFTSTLSNLTSSTTYFVRAYAENEAGIAYSPSTSFTTLGDPVLPSVSTIEPTSITQNSAVSGGIVSSDGGSSVTARGVCWSKQTMPTLSDDFTQDGTETGSFISSITSLDPNTLYFVRAYATNNVGTTFGDQYTFTTANEPTAPSVITGEAINISQTEAYIGGTVTSDGGANVTARGVCYSTNTIPTLDDQFTENGTGIGSFVATLTSLIPSTQYYVRAYAINNIGTTYGNEVVFETLAEPTIPTVTTSAITDITENTATSGGNVTDDGGSGVLAKGVCWSTNPSPTIADEHTADGTGTGAYISYLTALNSNTLYYVRAYATNSIGTAYGAEETFTTLPPPWTCGDSIVYEGQEYGTVLIGDQCWMDENLNFETGNSWCYDNNSSFCELYGRLYDWETVMNGAGSSNSVPSGVRGICPEGWHLPSDEEWKIIEGTVDGTYGIGDPVWDEIGWRGSNAGYRLKSTSGWYDGNGVDMFGFTALPGGYRAYTGLFQGEESYGAWWTTTEHESNPNNRYYRSLQSHDTYDARIGRYSNDKLNGYSIRCIKD